MVSVVKNLLADSPSRLSRATKLLVLAHHPGYGGGNEVATRIVPDSRNLVLDHRRERASAGSSAGRRLRAGQPTYPRKRGFWVAERTDAGGVSRENEA